MRKQSKLSRDPLWYKDAIIYELHVKSFFDSNNDGVGDFPGLIQKLDYLQDLGINCLWILPFYPSPLRDDGYDIADYRGVHPSYGTRRDFRNFVREAHRRGIRVITELVINHTSDQHPWFQAARRAPKGSSKRNFYVWSDTDQKYRDARIIFKDTEKSNWTWDPIAKAYYWHRFFHHQPDLNFDNPLVRRAVMRIMRFWLDMGVDGLRLDAIPYLIERDGTNCENLPETHVILKEMRAELDKRYKDRMFLAEANQWPADVRPYFGDGDECHMAFHFPLMPRIFMAIRQEDRHPITDILKQTPEIPDSCQWAIFLRNHDELTLEMVTDQERDYMYNEYAADPLMRLNLGIRRRLAPLVNNSRRRLELLFSLLFSFPGTPVLYYGDEIGMGDNFYLGDRNGVRTPMQWSSDRNAGFSRADFARLFTPPIMDAIYSYQTVNVEAQQRDPSSLYNWMKRIIAVSKRYKTFGRGKLEFLSPANRKVLAYVRRYEDETFLAVANLSRFVQPVEIDLKEFKGRVPVEMLGRTEFPKIGDLPYFLTLGPHSFYWFQLQPVAATLDVEPSAPAPETEDLPVLRGNGDWSALLRDEALVSAALPRFIAKQRWYAGKADPIKTVRIIRAEALPIAAPPAFLVVAEVESVAGTSGRYFVPMAIAQGEGGEQLAKDRPQLLIAQVETPRGRAYLHDGLADDAVCRYWAQLIEQRQEVQTGTARLQGIRTEAFSQAGAVDLPAVPVERLSGEQSNTSIRFDGTMIMKVYRKLEPGVNPDFETSRLLTETTHFNRTPPMMGGVLYKDGEHESALAMLQGFVRNQGDGWAMTLDVLSRYYDRVTSRLTALQSLSESEQRPPRLGDAAMPVAAGELIGSYVYSAGLLGKRTGELHRALAEVSDPAFTPERFTADHGAGLAQRVAREAAAAFKTLEASKGKLPAGLVGKVDHLLEMRSFFEQPRRAPSQDDIPRGRIRCHGDYHLGQVLWSNNDFIIVDFEGEPARSLRERREKQLPLKDVAGMLRSFHYAAYAGLFKAAAERPSDVTRLEPAARLWYHWTVATFLKEYRQTVDGAGLVPADAASFEHWLDVFLLEKAQYEVLYELNNRPAWISIPIEGLLALTPVAQKV